MKRWTDNARHEHTIRPREKMKYYRRFQYFIKIQQRMKLKISAKYLKRQYTPVYLCVHSFVSHVKHYIDVIMTTMASQITRLTVVYSIFYSGADQRKHQISASLAFVRGIHRWPGNSPHKWSATRKMFPFHNVIMLMNMALSIPFGQGYINVHMVTSSNESIFRITGHLCGEFTGPRWIRRTKVSDAELWCWLSKQWWGWWFEMLSLPLWRHGNEKHNLR